MSEELIKEFLIESFDNLSTISEDLTLLEKHPNDLDLINKIYRVIHTLKGSANFLNFQTLQKLTHTAENVLDLLRDEKIKITPNLVDILLATFDLCTEFVKNIEKSGNEGNVNFEENKTQLLGYIENLLSKTDSIDETLPVQPEEDYPEEVSSREDKETLESNVLHLADEEITKEIDITFETNETVERAPSVVDSIVKVDVTLLDKIMNEVGELVLNRNQILQYANQVKSNELARLVQQLNVITTELQTDIMTTRMQPIARILSKFERHARDLARSSQKEIKLEVSGKETELDKTLLEAIRDPLTHIVRNSVDHGIEKPAEREKAGKSREGKITFKSYNESGQVIIEVSDDGKGLDREKIIAKALEKELITKKDAESLKDEQIFSFILNPGFSTAARVTNVSGRGVGMDVVKSNVEAIGGSISVSSEPGVGTTFKLKIPLTLAIVPALIVKAANESFAISQVNLVELVHVDTEEADEDHQVSEVHGTHFFRLRGSLIPLFWLSDVLNMDHEKNKRDMNIVILNAEGCTFGLVVDSILNTEEIVVKPFGKMLKDINTFAGATIIGDGEVALIIDALGFYKYVNKANKSTENSIVNRSQANSQKEDDSAEYQENLLLELADERTYCIPLSLVYRLEEFKTSKIEYTGLQPVIQYNGRPIPLINIEKSLGYKAKSLLEVIKEDKTINKVPCIVLSIHGQLFGLVVKKILDISISEVVIDTDTVDRDGIIGTVVIDEKLISLLDPYGLLKMQAYIKFGSSKKDNSFAGKKILLVDDSAMYRKLEGEAFDELGAEVVYAENGEEGLRQLNKNEDVDLIITDIEMPIMDGFEFSKKVRALDKFKNLSIIALSTRVSEKDLAKGRDCGFSSHIEKFKKDQVIELVSKYLTNG